MTSVIDPFSACRTRFATLERTRLRRLILARRGRIEGWFVARAGKDGRPPRSKAILARWGLAPRRLVARDVGDRRWKMNSHALRVRRARLGVHGGAEDRRAARIAQHRPGARTSPSVPCSRSSNRWSRFDSALDQGPQRRLIAWPKPPTRSPSSKSSRRSTVPFAARPPSPATTPRRPRQTPRRHLQPGRRTNPQSIWRRSNLRTGCQGIERTADRQWPRHRFRPIPSLPTLFPLLT